MELDREITWIKTKNTVAERMVESSFIHRLVPRKLSKKRKMLNTLFKKNLYLTTYSQYVTKKTSALQHFSDDSQTEDDAFSDCDYSQLCESNSLFNESVVRNSKKSADVLECQKTNESLLTKKSKIKEEKEIMSKNTPDIKEEENHLRSIVIDWRNVTQSNVQTTEPSSSSDHTCISASSVEVKEMLSDYNCSLKSDKRQWHSLNDESSQEVPPTKKLKVSNSIDRNLVPKRKSDTINSYKYNMKHIDIEYNISPDSCNMWDESQHILNQSTPIYECTTHKTDNKVHESLSNKDLKNYPQDSGIDEESSRDCKSNRNNLTDHLQERTEISRNVKTSTVKGIIEKEMEKSHIKRNNSISPQCLENMNGNSLQTCRTDNVLEKEDVNYIKRRSAKINLNRVFENESAKSKFDTGNRISFDFKRSECREVNEISKKFANKKNKTLKHDKQKITPTHNGVLEISKSNKYDSKPNETMIDADNSSENTICKNDQIEMENPNFADSEDSGCTKLSQMSFKSMKEEDVNIKHNKKNRILNNGLSECRISEAFCNTIIENEWHRNNCNEERSKLQAFDSHHESNYEISKSKAECTQKQKLAPKVMSTEVINKKYKIMFQDEYIPRRNNVENVLDSSVSTFSNSTTTSHDEEENNSAIDANNKYNSHKENLVDMKIGSQRVPEVAAQVESFKAHKGTVINVHEDINQTKEENVQEIKNEDEEESRDSQIEISQKEEKLSNVFEKSNDDEQVFKDASNIVCTSSGSLFDNEFLRKGVVEDEDSYDNEQDTVSPRTIRRLQQLERLNLTASSDSSSEEEVEVKDTRTLYNGTLKIKNNSQDKQKTVVIQKKNTGAQDEKHLGQAVNQSSSRLQCRKRNENEGQKTNNQGSLRQEWRQSIHQENIEKDYDTMCNESTEEEFSNIRKRETNTQHKRPTTLEELIIQEELIKNKTPATFNLKNIEDEEEVYVLNIPRAVNVNNLKGKRMVLKGNKLKLDNEMYKIKHRSLGSVTCVFHKGKKHTSYKVVNTRPLGSITTRYKYFDQLSDLLNIEESTEDDTFVADSSLKEEKCNTKSKSKTYKKAVNS